MVVGHGECGDLSLPGDGDGGGDSNGGMFTGVAGSTAHNSCFINLVIFILLLPLFLVVATVY